jgi:putative ABC transport system permease protein
VSNGSAPGEILLDRAVVRRHDPSALSSAVYLSAPAQPAIGARIVDVATYAAQADAESDRLVWLFTVLLVAVSAGYGAIAVANTLLLAAAARREDFRLLWRCGASIRQVCLVVATESVLVVLIGSLLGGAVAAIALAGGLAALRQRAGAPVGLVLPWPAISGVIGSCVVLALLASVVPTRMGLRRRRLGRKRRLR